MKLKRRSNITIAKSLMPTANTVLEPLDYQKWKYFIENHSDYFIWNEDTAEGKRIIEKINEFSERLKVKVLATLNKGICFSELNNVTEKYNISVTFYEELNWVAIQFSRTPKPKDLQIFVKMAASLDAHLLIDGTTIINDRTLIELS
ncbi:MAG: hypothetical protein OCD76_23180 [Reichenbachiella sp.]